MAPSQSRTVQSLDVSGTRPSSPRPMRSPPMPTMATALRITRPIRASSVTPNVRLASYLVQYFSLNPTSSKPATREDSKPASLTHAIRHNQDLCLDNAPGLEAAAPAPADAPGPARSCRGAGVADSGTDRRSTTTYPRISYCFGRL